MSFNRFVTQDGEECMCGGRGINVLKMYGTHQSEALTAPLLCTCSAKIFFVLDFIRNFSQFRISALLKITYANNPVTPFPTNTILYTQIDRHQNSHDLLIRACYVKDAERSVRCYISFSLNVSKTKYAKFIQMMNQTQLLKSLKKANSI